VGTVDADHEHGGQRGELDRHPHHADIVGDEREVHREHQHLIHGVVEAQEARGQSPDLELVADIGGAEHAGGEADERGQHDEHVVEVVDEKIGAGLRAAEEQRDRRKQGQERRRHIERRAEPIARQHRE
jgi:hypothetical protein